MKNTNYQNIDISGPILDLCFTMAIGRNLVPLVLKKALSLEMVESDICSVGTSKQNAPFQKMCRKKRNHAPIVNNRFCT